MKFLYSLALIGCILLAQSASAATHTTQDQYRDSLLQLIELLQAQIQLLTNVVTHEESDFYPADKNIIVRYQVSDRGLIVAEEPVHAVYFDRVVELFPDRYDAYLKEFLVFATAEDRGDAFVSTAAVESNNWTFGVAEHMLTETDLVENTELIVHEFGHVLSYEQARKTDISQIDCHTYFSDTGCPPAGSYLSLYTNAFWSDSDLERAELRVDATRDAAYYRQFSDRYVSRYATQSPEEDFSETFLSFVLGDVPVVGTTARLKYDFMQQWPEIAQVKSEILSNF